MAASWTPLDSISVTSTQAGTEAAPLSSTDGMSLEAVIAVTVWLDAGQGQTITSDAGQADWYVYDNGSWGLAAMEPLAVPPHAAGQRRVSLGTVSVANQRGRLAPILNGVLVSGATATLDILATIDRSGRAKAAQVESTLGDPNIRKRFGLTVDGVPSTVSASGDTVIHLCPNGKHLRLRWISLYSDPGNAGSCLVNVKWSATSGNLYRIPFPAGLGAFMHSSVREGAVNESLVVNLSGAQTIYVAGLDVEEF